MWKVSLQWIKVCVSAKIFYAYLLPTDEIESFVNYLLAQSSSLTSIFWRKTPNSFHPKKFYVVGVKKSKWKCGEHVSMLLWVSQNFIFLCSHLSSHSPHILPSRFHKQFFSASRPPRFFSHHTPNAPNPPRVWVCGVCECATEQFCFSFRNARHLTEPIDVRVATVFLHWKK